MTQEEILQKLLEANEALIERVSQLEGIVARLEEAANNAACTAARVEESIPALNSVANRLEELRS